MLDNELATIMEFCRCARLGQEVLAVLCLLRHYQSARNTSRA